MNFINQYCHIRDRVVTHQGKALFNGRSSTLDNFMEEVYEFLSPAYPKFYKMDRLSKLGFLACEIIVKDISIHSKYAPEQVAVVLSNASASLDTDLQYAESLTTIASPGLFVYTLPNIVAGEICIRQGIQGENAFFITEKFEAKLMADYVDLVITAGKTRACIAGWTEILGDHHDIFLYLVGNEKGAIGLEHTAKQLQKIYTVI